MNKYERQGAILRLVRNVALDAGRARRGAARAGHRGRADHRLPRHPPARSREDARRRRPARLCAPRRRRPRPAQRARRGALRRWALSSRRPTHSSVIMTPPGFATPLADAIDAAGLPTSPAPSPARTRSSSSRAPAFRRPDRDELAASPSGRRQHEQTAASPSRAASTRAASSSWLKRGLRLRRGRRRARRRRPRRSTSTARWNAAGPPAPKTSSSSTAGKLSQRSRWRRRSRRTRSTRASTRSSRPSRAR